MNQPPAERPHNDQGATLHFDPTPVPARAHAQGLGPELRTLINRLAFERVRAQGIRDARAMRRAAVDRLRQGESHAALVAEVSRDLAALAALEMAQR